MLPELRNRIAELELADCKLREVVAHIEKSDVGGNICSESSALQMRVSSMLVDAKEELAAREREILGQGIIRAKFSLGGDMRSAVNVIISSPDKKHADPYLPWSIWRGVNAIFGYIGDKARSNPFPSSIITDKDYDIIILNESDSPVAVCTKNGTREL